MREHRQNPAGQRRPPAGRGRSGAPHAAGLRAYMFPGPGGARRHGTAGQGGGEPAAVRGGATAASARRGPGCAWRSCLSSSSRSSSSPYCLSPWCSWIGGAATGGRLRSVSWWWPALVSGGCRRRERVTPQSCYSGFLELRVPACSAARGDRGAGDVPWCMPGVVVAAACVSSPGRGPATVSPAVPPGRVSSGPPPVFGCFGFRFESLLRYIFILGIFVRVYVRQFSFRTFPSNSTCISPKSGTKASINWCRTDPCSCSVF